MHPIVFLVTLPVLAVTESFDLQTQNFAGDEFTENCSSTFSLTDMREISTYSKLDKFKELAEDIKKRGAIVLRNLSVLITEAAVKKTNISLNMEELIENYNTQIQNAHDFAARLETEFGVDEVYLFMDLLEAGCKTLYVEQRGFLQNLEEKYSLKLFGVPTIKHHAIFQAAVSFKKNELLGMCKKYDICVPYSEFNVYLQYFFDEIMLLPDPEIGMIINLLSEIIRNDPNFVELVDYDEKIILLVKALFENTYKMKKSLTILRKFLRNRHMLCLTTEYKYKIRLQAVRALLDSMDKAFYFNHGDKFLVDIYATVKAVRNWGSETANFKITNDISELDHYKVVIMTFVSRVFEVINFEKKHKNHYFIKTIITGNLENITSYSNLFRNGYKGVYTLDNKYKLIH